MGATVRRGLLRGRNRVRIAVAQDVTGPCCMGARGGGRSHVRESDSLRCGPFCARGPRRAIGTATATETETAMGSRTACGAGDGGDGSTRGLGCVAGSGFANGNHRGVVCSAGMIGAGGLCQTRRYRRRGIHASVCVCASAPCPQTVSDSCAAGDARAGGGPSCRVLAPGYPMIGGGGGDCRGRGRGRLSGTGGSF